MVLLAYSPWPKPKLKILGKRFNVRLVNISKDLLNYSNLC